MNNGGEDGSMIACRRALRALTGVAGVLPPRAGLDNVSVPRIRLALLSPFSRFFHSQSAMAAAVTFLLGSCSNVASASQRSYRGPAALSIMTSMDPTAQSRCGPGTAA